MTGQQTDLFLRNQRFAGLKFPDMHRPETLEHRFGHLLDTQAMSFLMYVFASCCCTTLSFECWQLWVHAAVNLHDSMFANGQDCVVLLVPLTRCLLCNHM